MEELWKNVILYVPHAPVLCHLIQTCSLAYIKGCHCHRTGLIPRETGKVGVVRERGRTADDRVIKAELRLPDWARRRVTVRPSRLLIMTWAFKNWPLLSRPSLHCAGDVKY